MNLFNSGLLFSFSRTFFIVAVFGMISINTFASDGGSSGGAACKANHGIVVSGGGSGYTINKCPHIADINLVLDSFKHKCTNEGFLGLGKSKLQLANLKVKETSCKDGKKSLSECLTDVSGAVELIKTSLSNVITQCDNLKKALAGVCESSAKMETVVPEGTEDCVADTLDFVFQDLPENISKMNKQKAELEKTKDDYRKSGIALKWVKNNPGKTMLGAGAVGTVALVDKHKRDKRKDKRKQEAYDRALRLGRDSAQFDLDAAGACAQTGAENFPACEGYLLDQCPMYYGGKLAPFAGEKSPRRDAYGDDAQYEVARFQYESRQKTSRVLSGVCSRFKNSYCGSGSSETLNSGGEFCQAMNERSYCLSSSNSKAPSCIRMAQQNNVLCQNGGCDEPYSEEYLAKACGNYPSDPICMERAEMNVQADMSKSSKASQKNTLGASDGSDNNFVLLPTGSNGGLQKATFSVQRGPAQALPADISGLYGPSNYSVLSSEMHKLCSQGQLVGCVKKSP